MNMKTFASNTRKKRNEFQPTSNPYYEYLRADAIIGKPTKISFIDNFGAIEESYGIIKDLHSHIGEEYLVMDSGMVIKLDTITKINGVKRPGL